MRRALIRIFVASTVLWLADPLPPSEAQGDVDPLADVRHDRRLFILFSPSEDDVRLTAAMRTLASRHCSLQDRDVVVVVVLADGTGRVGERPLTRWASDALRTRHAVGSDAFAFVLIGKDGGEKLRAGELPELDDVFGFIDGMPMRRAEAAGRPSACD